jgi:phage shock protein PspC (stress-responsive transcriptional regulator)
MRKMSQKQLTRSRDNLMVRGVISGIAEYFGWSRDVVTLLRILFVVLAFGSWGGLFFLYFVAAWIMPSSSERGNYRERQNDYEDRWEQKAKRWEDQADRWSRKMEEKADRFSQKMDNKFGNSSDRSNQTNNWGNPWDAPKNSERKMKDVEPIIDKKEDDWSDF